VTLPSAEVVLHARALGSVSRLLVPEGQVVKKGTPLIELSNELTHEKLIQAEANHEKAKLSYKGYQKLVENNHISKLKLNEAYAYLKQTEYALQQAKKYLSERYILAPFDGVINDYKVKVGELVYANGSIPTPLGTFVQLDPLEIVVHANQQQIKSLKKGQRVEVNFAEGTTVESVVSSIEPNPNKILQTFAVHIFLENQKGHLKAGVSALAKIYLKEQNASFVPMSALVYEDSGKIGLKIVDAQNQVRFVPVSILKTEHNHFWVSGLHGDERVILQGHSYVNEGQKVIPVSFEES
jgi:multidrug efflux system membrane fusion protein